MKTVTKEKAHSPYAASSSHRWLKCPGSIKLSEKAPKQLSSSFADEGTFAHNYAEHCLVFRENPLETKEFDGKKIDREMQEAVYKYWEYCIGLQQKHGGEIGVERRVFLKAAHKDAFGTNDFDHQVPFLSLEVVDFKYGQGIVVEAIDNPQLAYYACGIAAENDWDFETITMTICQPRAYHPEGPIRSWTITVEELKTWEYKFKFGIKAALEKNPKLAAGDHCHFCPARPLCPEQKNEAQKMCADAFADDSDIQLVADLIPDPQMLNAKEIEDILMRADIVEGWLESVRKVAFDLAESGTRFKNFKLVAKQSRRQWAMLEDIEKRVNKISRCKELAGLEVYNLDLKSPSQIEKEVGKEKFKKYFASEVVSVSSGRTLVHNSDRRPEFDKNKNAQLIFDDQSLKEIKNVKSKSKK